MNIKTIKSITRTEWHSVRSPVKYEFNKPISYDVDKLTDRQLAKLVHAHIDSSNADPEMLSLDIDWESNVTHITDFSDYEIKFA